MRSVFCISAAALLFVAATPALADKQCDRAVATMQARMPAFQQEATAILKLPPIPVPPFNQQKLTRAQLTKACDVWAKHDFSKLRRDLDDLVVMGDAAHAKCTRTSSPLDIGAIMRSTRSMTVGSLDNRAQCRAVGHPWKPEKKS